MTSNSGIYSIRNLENGKIYIGSAINLGRRWTEHKYRLNNNTHTNPHLLRSWNKYGKDNFEFSIIEECNSDMLVIREQAWINYYQSNNPDKGYNIRDAGSRGKLSEETRRKISEASKGRKASKETIAKRTGLKRSEETKAKMRSARSKQVISQETKDKIRKALLGRSSYIRTEEHKQKMSKALRGE